MIYLNCGRCGGYLGMAKNAEEARVINREHIVECEIAS